MENDLAVKQKLRYRKSRDTAKTAPSLLSSSEACSELEAPMGSEFGSRLRARRETIGLSGNRLAQRSGILQGTLVGIERGTRPPSQANLEALAAVPELRTPLEVLQAWADLDKIGAEGLERIKKYAPEALGLPANDIPELNVVEGSAKPDLPDDASPRERKLLEKMGIWADPSHPLHPAAGGYVWTLPKEERWRALKEELAAWEEEQSFGSKGAG